MDMSKEEFLAKCEELRKERDSANNRRYKLIKEYEESLPFKPGMWVEVKRPMRTRVLCLKNVYVDKCNPENLIVIGFKKKDDGTKSKIETNFRNVKVEDITIINSK